MGAFAKITREQLNRIKKYYGKGILQYVYTKGKGGAYIRYVDMKAAGKRINGIYIGHGYLLSDMR